MSQYTPAMPELLHSAVFGLPAPRLGKVREVYDLAPHTGCDEVLIVATDRISAFDCTMASGIPGKGVLLTAMSAWWFERLAGLGPNHLVTTDDAEVQRRLPRSQPELKGRATVARAARPLPVECVARGYLMGSLYKEYVEHGGKIHGLDLPDGLAEASRLPEPIFTPATKATSGHDENIGFADVANVVGEETAARVRDWTLALYREASARAESVGLILADTKFEFGHAADGELLLIDEALTPDSSRYWDAARYAPGGSPASFDKQYVRDFLASSDWDRTPPGPVLPPDVVAGTRARYIECYERITGARDSRPRRRYRSPDLYSRPQVEPHLRAGLGPRPSCGQECPRSYASNGEQCGYRSPDLYLSPRALRDWAGTGRETCAYRVQPLPSSLFRSAARR